MELASLIVSIGATVISLVAAYASWRAVRPRPKLLGSITCVWPQFNFEGGFVVLMHIKVTNRSSHPIHLLGYDLEVSMDNGLVPGSRIQNWNFEIPPLHVNRGESLAHLTREHLIDWPPKPVHHGTPLMGFLMFIVFGNFEEQQIRGYRLNVVDAFGHQEHFEISATAADSWDQRHFTMLDLLRYAGVPIEPAPRPE